MNDSIFWRRWVKPTFNYKLLSFEDIESEETKSESTDSKKMNGIYYDFKDGVLTIPIFDDERYNALEIHINPSSSVFEVVWRGNEPANEEKIGFHLANRRIIETKPKPVVLNEINVDLSECYRIENYRLQKVVELNFTIDLRKYSINDLTLEDLLLKQGWYKDKDAAIQALPNDIVIKKGPVQWDSRAYDKDGIYSVVNVFSLDGGKSIGIHLTKNKKISAHE